MDSQQDQHNKRRRLITETLSSMDPDTLVALHGLHLMYTLNCARTIDVPVHTPVVLPIQFTMPSPAPALSSVATIAAPSSAATIAIPAPVPVPVACIRINLSGLTLRGLDKLTAPNRKLFFELIAFWYALDGSSGTPRTKRLLFKHLDQRGFFDDKGVATEQARIMQSIAEFIRTTVAANHEHVLAVPRKLVISDDFEVAIDYFTIATLDNLANAFHGMIVDAIKCGKLEDI